MLIAETKKFSFNWISLNFLHSNVLTEPSMVIVYRFRRDFRSQRIRHGKKKAHCEEMFFFALDRFLFLGGLYTEFVRLSKSLIGFSDDCRNLSRLGQWNVSIEFFLCQFNENSKKNDWNFFLFRLKTTTNVSSTIWKEIFPARFCSTSWWIFALDWEHDPKWSLVIHIDIEISSKVASEEQQNKRCLSNCSTVL